MLELHFTAVAEAMDSLDDGAGGAEFFSQGGDMHINVSFGDGRITAEFIH